jgi:carbon-monoxide dehydrogenase large subunit
MTADRPGLLGARVTRVEDRRLITGGSRFIDDLSRPGMLHMRLVRSPFAAARILGLPEVDLAQTSGGGALLFTGEEIEGGITADTDLEGWRSSTQPLLAHGRVRYTGEPVAAVLHPDPYVSEDLAESVFFDFDPEPAIASIEAALAPGAPLIHEDWERNVFITRGACFGDLDAARDGADMTLRRVFRTSRQAGVPLECRGALADPDGRGGLTLWSSTQVPHLVRSVVAHCLDLAENMVRVVAPDVGGGFGVKGHVFPEEVLVATLALRTGRPVKWIEDRREHLLASIHAREHIHVLEAYVRGDGRVLGVKAQLLVDVGAYSVYPWTAGSDSGMASKILLGPYDIGSYQVEDHAVATNKCPLGTYRGVGRPSAVFSMERMMDEIGRELGIDPFEIRRRNLVREFPHTTVNGLLLDSGSYIEALETMRGLVGEPNLAPDVGSSERLGVGIAFYNEQTAHGTLDFERRKTPIAAGYESADMEMDPQGRLTIRTGLQSHGQGMETTLAQIAAHELGIPIEHVRVLHGDSDFPYTMGTWGSRGAALGGGAVARGARAIRSKLVEIAALNLEISTEDLEVADGVVRVKGSPERALDIGTLASWAVIRPARIPEGMAPGLRTHESVDGPPLGAFAYACHAAVVSVDTGTGKVRLRRYVVIEDCGTMINPMIVDGQVHGGVAQGIGSALLEEFHYDPDGQPLSTTFIDYLMPSTTDVPDIEVHHIVTPSPFTEHGIKGMGEAGAIGPMAAIANAVSDAIGRPANQTPLRMGRVWDLLTGGGEDDFTWRLDELGLGGFWSDPSP